MPRKPKNARKCLKCEKEKSLEINYYTSKSINAKDGRMMICKDCINDMIDVNDVSSIKNVLRELNIPFIPKYWESAKKSKQKTFGSYIRQVNSFHQTQNMSYDDSPVVNEDGEEAVQMDMEDDFEVTRDMIKFWGKGYTKSEYQFLEDYYFSYTQVYADDTPVQVNIYKNIAKTQLQADKSLQTGDMDTYKKLMDVISKLHNDGNIKPIQDSGDDDAKNSMGVWIQQIEREEPIPKPLPQFLDVDRIEKYIKAWFTNHMQKVLGVYREGDEIGG